jgi:hypothetical protein
MGVMKYKNSEGEWVPVRGSREVLVGDTAPTTPVPIWVDTSKNQEIPSILHSVDGVGPDSTGNVVLGAALKAPAPTAGHIATLDVDGNLVDSTKSVSDLATSAQGVPTGGAAGQVLEKINSEDYNTQWASLASRILSMVYPVGSIYMNFANTSPASFLGGTWEQIKDIFLLAAGDTYAAGSTGGSATVTIAENNLPSNSIIRSNSWTVGGSCDTDNVAYSSGFCNGSLFDSGHTYGQPISKLPPYKAVYIWERVA